MTVSLGESPNCEATPWSPFRPPPSSPRNRRRPESARPTSHAGPAPLSSQWAQKACQVLGAADTPRRQEVCRPASAHPSRSRPASAQPSSSLFPGYIATPGQQYAAPPAVVVRSYGGHRDGLLQYQVGKLSPLTPTFSPAWVHDPPQRLNIMDLRLQPSQRAPSCYRCASNTAQATLLQARSLLPFAGHYAHRAECTAIRMCCVCFGTQCSPEFITARSGFAVDPPSPPRSARPNSAAASAASSPRIANPAPTSPRATSPRRNTSSTEPEEPAPNTLPPPGQHRTVGRTLIAYVRQVASCDASGLQQQSQNQPLPQRPQTAGALSTRVSSAQYIPSPGSPTRWGGKVRQASARPTSAARHRQAETGLCESGNYFEGIRKGLAHSPVTEAVRHRTQSSFTPQGMQQESVMTRAMRVSVCVCVCVFAQRIYHSKSVSYMQSCIHQCAASTIAPCVRACVCASRRVVWPEQGLRVSQRAES